MSGIISALWVLAVVGAICAVLLILASKYMKVPVDEKFPKIRECLPGANCGACGYAGCDGYANALAAGDETKINKCIPGADGVAQQLSEILGLEFEDVVEMVAFSGCRGTCDNTKKKANYEGIESCKAAKLIYGGPGDCIYGCLGLGDCAKVCPNEAITIVNGIAMVNSALCTGCGLCARTCPNHVIYLIPDVVKVAVTCRNEEKGAATRKRCSHGCIGCHKCEKECPVQAVKIVNNLAVIDYDVCTGCGHCAEICTTGCILPADFTGIHKVNK